MVEIWERGKYSSYSSWNVLFQVRNQSNRREVATMHVSCWKTVRTHGRQETNEAALDVFVGVNIFVQTAS
jgi:hypothetical protein